MAITVNSSAWRRTSATRGDRGAAQVLPGLPSMFVPPGADVSDEITVEPAAPTRGAAPGVAGPLDISTDVQPDQVAVLAIRQPSGALTFHLPVESQTRGTRGGPAQVRFQVVVRSTPTGPATRGIVTKLVKAIVVKVAKIAVDKVASLVVPKAVAAIERAIWTRKGLAQGWVRVTKAALAAGKLPAGLPVLPDRSLLLIHGTFSNAEAGFNGLAETDFFERIKDTYGDRIFAFNHFSLSLTPEENAKMLVDALPRHETTFDVVTHSRGGLVLRNVVERASALGPAARRFKLGRAALVASPNNGTPLATPDRWQQTLDWLANILEFFPENPFTTGAELVANGLSWLANHLAVDVPGLHAMDGRGEPIDLLQDEPGPPADAYSALVANYNPSSGIPARFFDAGIDQFFGGANDLVVPTAGGWQVDRVAKPFIPSDRIGCYGPGGNLAADSVSHVGFFGRRETVDFLINALEGRRHRLVDIDPRRPLPDRRLVRSATTLTEPTPVEPAAAAPPRATARGARAAAVEPTSEAASVQVKVRVRNGDLQFESSPLMLGHYTSERLTGTEWVMDSLIGHAMTRSLNAGVYPVEVGSHQVFINRYRDPSRAIMIPRPESVIVVGLGPEGELTGGNLVKSVRLAVIGWARHLAERYPNQKTFELASTLIASGGTGISAALSARSILLGVLQANEALADANPKEDSATSRAKNSDDSTWPLCRSLRLIELYLERAGEAWRSLERQLQVTPGRFDVGNGVERGNGGLVRPSDSGYRGADYDFLTITTTQLLSDEASTGDDREVRPETQINYNLDSRRARSEVRAVQPQGNLVKQLVETASNDRVADHRIGRTLFNLLVPIELEADLSSISALQIELDQTVSDIPWELLDVRHDGAASADPEPWAIRTRLLRKFRTTTFRERVVDADASARVLVIGEPDCPDTFIRLESARLEAQAVCGEFGQTLKAGDGNDAVELLAAADPDAPRPGSQQILNTLYNESWRIVHIAGHGVLKDKDHPVTGVVLANGTYLSAAEIKAMRTVPELVFVNCCYLGRGDTRQLLKPYNRAQFASGVARALIDIGVRCVVATGWAVEDRPAEVFATTFYRKLLSGWTFQDSVHAAREATYQANPAGTTWAAYQCYGDPGWTFQTREGDANVPNERRDVRTRVATWRALRLELERISVQAKSTSGDPATFLQEVRALEAQHGEQWGRLGDVAHAFGAAFFAVGAMRDAIRWLEPAVKATDAAAPIRAGEQLVNARSRFAWESVDDAVRARDQATAMLRRLEGARPQADRKTRARARAEVTRADRALRAAIAEAKRDITQALNELKPLHALGSTAERWNLEGSAYKRRALVALAEDRSKSARPALRAMLAAYHKGMDDARREAKGDLFYPGLNCLGGTLALGADGGRQKPVLDRTIVREVTDSLATKKDYTADFWSEVSRIELEQYLAMEKRQLARAKAGLTKKYKLLHDRAKSLKMWGSVYDNASLVLKRYGASGSRPERNAADELLIMLRGLARPAIAE